MSLRLARRCINAASALIWIGATSFALGTLPRWLGLVLAVFLLGIALGTITEWGRSILRRQVPPT